MKLTQKQKILNRIEEVGYVDNFWAIQNYILRLGAVIHSLQDDGYSFDRRFGRGKNKKNYYYFSTPLRKLTELDK